MFQQHSAPGTQRGRESGNTENQDHPGLPRRKSTGKEERKRGRKRRFAPSHTRFRAQPSAAGRAARQSREPPAGMSPCSPGCWRPRLPPRSCCLSSRQPLWHFRGRRGFASVLLNNMVVTRVGFSDRRKSEVWLCRLLRALGASLGLRFLGHQGERLTHASKGHTGSPRGRACSLEQLLGCPERSPRTERLRGSIQLTVFQALKVFAICLGRQAIKSLEKRHQYFPIIKLQGVWFQV